MDKLFWTFVILNAINVIIQTIKTLCTIKGGKLLAATLNAIAYGFYTVVVIYMVCDLPLMWKVLVVGSCNFVGVYTVKWFEEKLRKDKLWKIEMTIPNSRDNVWETLKDTLAAIKTPYNYIDINKYYLVNIYCATKEETSLMKCFAKEYNVKYFVSESKIS